MSDFTPDPEFDERARAAGRELRQPPPPDGLRHLQRARRNRRLAQAGGVAAVVALGVGGIVAVTRGGDDGTITTADSTVATLPGTSPATVAPATSPATHPPAVPTTSASTAPTSEPATAGPTTMPDDAPGVPTLWVGEKLAGYFTADDEFVAATSAEEVPDGVLGLPMEVHDSTSAVATATPTTEGCSNVYLSPSPGWGVWATADAPLAPAPDVSTGTDVDPDVVDAVNGDLAALGMEPLALRIFAGTLSADGTVDAYVVDFGHGDDAPTWIATWDDATGEFTTIEGDTDPTNALAMGVPLDTYLDLDADGNWEIVFGLGDGWDVRELATNESIVFGAAHPCPDALDLPPPAVPSAVLDLVGGWALAPGQEPVVIIRADGTGRSGTCELMAVAIDEWVGLPGSGPGCVPVGASPEVEDLIVDLGGGAQLRLDAAADQLVVSFDANRRLVRVS